ncbi:hypothetical protein V1511DRAFT_506946 [Dipodascopsis uninucleata]
MEKSIVEKVTARDRKYDRQLRLWAANGQAALEEANILLLTASVTGTEILKNLVLPGTGSFTIIDDKAVDQEDIDSNFFLDVDSIGKPRSQETMQRLQELNSDSIGFSQVLDLKSLDTLDPSFWEQYSTVIAYNVRPSVLRKVAKVLWDKSIPLIISKSIGFYGYLRIMVPEHTVVESHPDSTVDLRLDCPWPELVRYAGSINLSQLNEMEHAHVPYVALLLIFLKKWKDEHDGSLPTTYDDREKFKALIRAEIRSSDSENFDEALAAVWRATQKTSIPSSILSILKDNRAAELNETSTKFWILVRAVSEFVAEVEEGNGNLPLSGTLPDMKADSTSYVTLQNIYRDKARRDRDLIENRVKTLLNELGRDPGSITTDEISIFCKFSRYITVINGRSIEDEYNPESSKAEEILTGLKDSEDLMHIYLGFRAVELFEEQYERYPGSLEDVTEDTSRLQDIATKLIQGLGGSFLSPYTEKVLQEFVRAGGGELHNIASFMGGIGAQEIVKLITRQYTPMNNTTVFDGIQSKTQVWEL